MVLRQHRMKGMRLSLGVYVFLRPASLLHHFVPLRSRSQTVISHFSSPSFLPSTFVFLFLLIIDYPITVYSLLPPSSSLPRSTDRCFVIIPSRRHMRIQILRFRHAYHLDGVQILKCLQRDFVAVPPMRTRSGNGRWMTACREVRMDRFW